MPTGNDFCEYLWNHLGSVQGVLNRLNNDGTVLDDAGRMSGKYQILKTVL
jgi:hypothetical protein